MRALKWLLTALVCSLSFAGSAVSAGRDNRRQNGVTKDTTHNSPAAPNAWQWITLQPNLNVAAQVLTATGVDKQLQGPFTGTLLLPTNEAFAAYLSQTATPFDLTGAYAPFWKLFLGKLVDYHILLKSVPASQTLQSVTHSTRYSSNKVSQHSVTFVASGTCTPAGAPAKRRNKRRDPGSNPGLTCATAFVQDEQGNRVTFATANVAVQGGGFIHTMNSVLQPNDIYPSLSALLSSSPDFSTLRNVFGLIDAGLNITVLPDLENVPGTLAAPTNEAFSGVDPASFTASQLLSIITYHFCGPVTQPFRLLYTPFKTPTRRNPCLTLLGRTTGNANLTLTYTPNNRITFLTGSAATPTTSTAPITVTDITVPLKVVHVISKLLIPPQ